MLGEVKNDLRGELKDCIGREEIKFF